MNKQSKIGVWGFGVVGKSLFAYLSKKGFQNIFVFDVRKLNEIKGMQVLNDLHTFLHVCDFIFPSPGIDLSSYEEYKDKFLSELDFFYDRWQKPVIAVTGTLGKTTVASMIAKLLQQCGKNIVAAGNISPAMCDVLDSDFDSAVLELSSFQLEISKKFGPDLAIFTNFYPNHLDRHKTMTAYFAAKANIFLNQRSGQAVLMPICFYEKIKNLSINSDIYFFSEKDVMDIPDICEGVFCIRNNHVVLVTKNGTKEALDLNLIADVDTYLPNKIILAAVLYLKKVKLNTKFNFGAIEHRLEKFLTKGRVDFYNDSKSTTPQSTLVAVKKLASRPTILFLGGLGKGVDRTNMINQLQGQVKEVICFGLEAQILNEACIDAGIKSCAYDNLENAVKYCVKIVEPNDQVLFSPSGSSFDLFKNYVERGVVFKRLIF